MEKIQNLEKIIASIKNFKTDVCKKHIEELSNLSISVKDLKNLAVKEQRYEEAVKIRSIEIYLNKLLELEKDYAQKIFEIERDK